MTQEQLQGFRADGHSDENIASVLAETNQEAKKLLDSGMPATSVLDNVLGAKQEIPLTDEEITAQAVQEVRPGETASIPQILAGIAAETAISEGAKIAGTAIGAKIALVAGQAGPQALTPEEAVTVPTGATLGYVAGSLIGGVSGSIAAQKIEGKDDISWGRVISDTMLNFIPGTELKSGPKILRKASEQIAKRPIRAQMVIGAIAGPTSQAVENLVETGELPTATNLSLASGTSAVLAGALGVTQKQAVKLLGRFGKKSSTEIDEMINRGDRGAVAYVNALTENVDPKILNETLDSKAVVRHLTDLMKSHVAPSKLVGKETTEAMRAAKWESAAGREIGGLLGKNVEDAINKAPDPDSAKLFAADYLAGKTAEVPQGMEELGGQLSKARAYIREYQEGLLANHYSGQRVMPEPLKAEIERSLNDGDYVSRAYRFFDDAGFQPGENERKALMARLEADGMKPEEATAYIAQLNEKRAGNPDELATFTFSQNAGVLKEKKDIAPELRRYLGEYTEPGQHVQATMSKLSRLVAYDKADNAIATSLKELGLARSAKEGLDGDWIPLNLRRGQAHLGEDQLYAPPEIQRAVNELYGMKADEIVGDLAQKSFSDIWETGVSLSKAAKVLGNPPSYLVQVYGNTINAIGLASNPFKGSWRGLKMGLGQFADGPLRGIAGMRSATDIDYFKRVKELGLVPQGLQFADMQAGMQGGKVGHIASKMVEPLGKVYSTPDIALRLSVFENQKSLLRKAAVGADESTIEKIAARMTNDTYQNYDFLNSSLKTMSRKGLPLSQFASFTLELARNQYNQGLLVKKMISGELAQEMSQELGVRVDPKVLRGEGFKRAVALSAVYGGTATGLYMFNRQTVSEEQEMALRETVLPDWDENAPLALKRKDDGTVYWKNSTYIVPHMQVAAPFMSAMRGESFGDAMNKMAQTTKDGLADNGSFMFKSVAQALGNYDADAQRKISYNRDEWGNLMERASWGAKELLEPGLTREIKKSKSQPASVTVMRQAGIRVNTTTEEQGFSYKVRDIKESFEGTKQQLGQARYARYKELGRAMTKEELGTEYEMMNQVYKSTQAGLNKHVKNMRILGHSDDDITKMLMKNRVGSVQALNAIDGITDDLPVVDRKSVSEVYEEVLSQPGGDMASKILEIARTDKAMAQSLATMHKKQMKDTAINISEREKVIRNMSISDGTQAKWVLGEMQRSDRPEAVLDGYAKRGVISVETVRQIKMRQQAKGK